MEQITQERTTPEVLGRHCNRCGRWKTRDAFYWRPARKQITSICRACILAAALAKKAPLASKACEWCDEMYMPKMRDKGRFCSIKCQRTARNRRHGKGPFRFAVADGSKRCATCNEWKPIDEFSKRKDRNMAPLSSCRICSADLGRDRANSDHGRNARYLREYGVTLAWYQETLVAQGGACAICRKPPDPNNRNFPHLVIDHDHRTGTVRGLLCHLCNTGLGRVGDDLVRLRALMQYLAVFQ